MAEIKIQYKGSREVTLTNNYYPAESYLSNKNNINFNSIGNEFRDLLLNSTCGNLNDDNIKITQLPDKGRLFYLTNPNSTNPIYLNVYVGQIITVSALLNDNILRFNAEGSVNNEQTQSYLTNFKFERYCNLTSNNVIVTVNLNMISATRDFEIITPDDLDFFTRSNGYTDQVDLGFDYCSILNLQDSCFIYRQLRSGFDVQTGDRVFVNYDASIVFNGGLKYYKMIASVQPSGATSYIVKIDVNGLVTSVFGTCD